MKQLYSIPARFERLLGLRVDAQLRPVLDAERVYRFTQSSIVLGFSNLMFPLLVVVFFRDGVPALVLWPWFMVALSAAIYQFRYWHRHHNKPRRSSVSNSAMLQIAVLTGLAGASWSLILVFQAIHGDHIAILTLLTLITIIVSGGSLLLGWLPLAPFALFVTGAVPLLATFCVLEPASMAPIIVSGLSYTCLLILVIRRVFQQMVTDLRRERDLLDTLLRLQQVVDEKAEFVATTSHELRTPLNAIIGFSDAIRSQVFGPPQPPVYGEYAEHIHGSATHLLAVINDILDNARAEAVKDGGTDEAFDLAEVMTRATAMVIHRAREKEIALESQGAGAGIRVFGDSRRTLQILLNLMANGIKYTERGGRVRVRCKELSTGSLAITVSDNGIGMTATEITEALQPYGRTESARESGESGTGLGLTISRHLAMMQGGDLRINSRKGDGTEATLVLPPERWSRISPSRGPRQAAPVRDEPMAVSGDYKV